mmetsp:Transcript_36394/g.61756  ORF Transcript_36394/g.61756 Transcript_36394/m.61756 type:complete len:270 (-) Transcript_36394:474-1283(-)
MDPLSTRLARLSLNRVTKGGNSRSPVGLHNDVLNHIKFFVTCLENLESSAFASAIMPPSSCCDTLLPPTDPDPPMISSMLNPEPPPSPLFASRSPFPPHRSFSASSLVLPAPLPDGFFFPPPCLAELSWYCSTKLGPLAALCSAMRASSSGSFCARFCASLLSASSLSSNPAYCLLCGIICWNPRAVGLLSFLRPDRNPPSPSSTGATSIHSSRPPWCDADTTFSSSAAATTCASIALSPPRTSSHSLSRARFLLAANSDDDRPPLPPP